MSIDPRFHVFLKGLFKNTVDLVMRKLNADQAFIALADDSLERVQIVYSQGDDESSFLSITTNEGIAGQVIRTAKPYISVEVKKDLHYIESSPKVSEEVAVPLLLNGSVIGVLLADSFSVGTLNQDSVSTLMSISRWFSGEVDRLIQPANQTELTVEISVPSTVTDAEILSEVRTVSRLADDLHRSLGGHGLQVSELEIFEESLVPEDVPNG